jgi:hypothetical protein
MMKWVLCCLVLLWPCVSFAAPDLATTEGMATTCAALPADSRALKTNAERQAFVVCRDIALLQHVIRWMQEGMKEFHRGPDPERFRTEVRKELTYVRDQLKAVLVVEENAGGMLGEVAKGCPQGQGLNIATLFRNPARFPLAQDEMRSACVTVDSKHPASGLVTILNQVVERGRVDPQSPEWQFVRYVYWVN